MEPHGILARLGSFATEIDCDRLAAPIVHKAKALLLYGLAVGVASLRAPQPAQAARAIDRDSSDGGGSATRLIDRRRLDPASAAFCNSALMHARVQDDAHPCGHLGVVVIPVALACAERYGAAGRDVLAALVAGYETALRIGRDHAADLSRRGFRTTPAYGVFAAAACAARVRKVDAKTCAHALSLATNAAGGLREWSEAGTGEGPFQVALAARNGLLAVDLAATGVEGAQTALTGRAGFFRAYGSESGDYARRVCDALGEDFELEKITYKPYPICQFLTGVVHGTVELSRRANGRSARAIAVHMNPFEAEFVGIPYAGPFSSFAQTLMSAPFCAALAWARQAVTFDGLHDFADDAVLALVEKTAVVSDASRARYASRIAVTLDDGGTMEWEENEGADAYRLTWERACGMNAQLCAEVGVSERNTRALAAGVDAIDRAPDVRALIGAWSACAEEAQRA